MAANVNNLRLLRGIIREFRHISGKSSLRNDPTITYIVDQFRDHQVTSEKVCRSKDEMRHLGQMYRCYLESVRRHEEVTAQYKGKGERTVEESAQLVGLAMPKTED